MRLKSTGIIVLVLNSILAASSPAFSAAKTSAGIEVPAAVSIETPLFETVQLPTWVTCHLAATNAWATSCAKSDPSGSNILETIAIGIPGSFESSPTSFADCSPVSLLGASLPSSLTRSNLSDSAILLASAARRWASAATAMLAAAAARAWSAWAFASAVAADNVAVSLFNSAILSDADCLAKSQWCSLTIPIQTMATVDTTPITRLPIRTKLARSNIQLTHSSEGHGSFPAWFPISVMITIATIGLGGLATYRQRYPPTRLITPMLPHPKRFEATALLYPDHEQELDHQHRGYEFRVRPFGPPRNDGVRPCCGS